MSRSLVPRRGVAPRWCQLALRHIQKVLQQAVVAADVAGLASTVEGKWPGASEAIERLYVGTR